MQECVARAVGQLDEAETLLGFEPFDRRLNRRAGGFLEARSAKAGGSAEVAGRRLEILVVEAAPAPLPEISVLVQVKCPDLARVVPSSCHIFNDCVSADPQITK
jgi:hypothetical protein